MLYPAVFVGLTLAAALTVRFKKLTFPAAIVGVFIGTAIFLGAGFPGLLILAGFFIAGTLATAHKKSVKAGIGLEEKNSGRRSVNQVLANGSVAALCGISAFLFPAYSEVFILMLASSLASATADTLSSELGNIYGKKFYNIINFKPDRRGLDGVVSLEGTLCGIVGSVFIGLISVSAISEITYVVVIIISGIFGNIVDSIFGAGLQRKGILKNDGVNFLNTLFSAIFSFCIFLLPCNRLLIFL